MSLTRLASMLLPLTLTIACAGDQDGPPFAEGRIYVHQVDGVGPPGQELCPPSCNHVVVFCPDGSATFSLSDIREPGNYRRTADEVLLDLTDSAGGAPDVIAFTLLDDGASVRDDYLDEVWSSYSGPAISIEDSSYCPSGLASGD